MLSTSALTFAYPNGTSFEFPDLNVEQNEGLLVLGNSGKGKTTLLHLLAGLLDPTGGTIDLGKSGGTGNTEISQEAC